MRHAVERDPLSRLYHFGLAQSFYLSGQYEKALAQCRRAIDLDPSYWSAHWQMAFVYLAQSDCEAAIAAAEAARRLDPLSSWINGVLSLAHARAGNTAEAAALLSDVKAPAFAAIAHAGLHQWGEAFAALDRAIEERSPFAVALRVDPIFTSLRSDPRYRTLLRKLNLENPQL